MPASPGEILEGQVVKLLKYGAIVQLGDGETGLVHISEIANEYVKDVGDYLREGDTVTVKALARKEPNRLELSIKQAAPGGGSAPPPPRRRAPDEDFERRLDDFMKRSNQLQNERRRSRDPKRRGG
jgi:S1 RNA binding domain protein